MGGVISWWIAIPAYIAISGAPDGTATEIGGVIWNSQIRYLGRRCYGCWRALGTHQLEKVNKFRR